MRFCTAGSWIFGERCAQQRSAPKWQAHPYRLATLPSARLERAKFLDLLDGKGKPDFDFGIKCALQVQIDGNMQQRTGGREHQCLCRSWLLHDGLDAVEHGMRSVRHTLRPSTTPSERIEIRRCLREHASSCSGAQTRSRCRPATGRRAPCRDCRQVLRNRW